jgi:integrase
MPTSKVRALRDRKAATPEAANERLKALRQVFLMAINNDLAERNPARDVPYIRTGSQGFHTWTFEEVRRYEVRHPVGTKARLALALLLFTGQRRSDVVRFGRQHAKGGWLTFTQTKNQKRRPVTLSIPILPELQTILDAMPSSNMTFLVTEFGKPFTSNGFGNRFRKWCDEAQLPHVSAHGLRKAGAVIAAENGASERQLMAVFGWSTMKEAARYTRAARQKVLAASAMPLLISGQTANK